MQQRKIRAEEVETLWKNLILLKSVRCLKSSRPHSIRISLTPMASYEESFCKRYSRHCWLYLVYDCNSLSTYLSLDFITEIRFLVYFSYSVWNSDGLCMFSGRPVNAPGRCWRCHASATESKACFARQQVRCVHCKQTGFCCVSEAFTSWAGTVWILNTVIE